MRKLHAVATAMACLTLSTTLLALDVAPPNLRGIDHFMWAVRDLGRARAFFHDSLGFDFASPRNDLGELATLWIWFEDDTFLEPFEPVGDSAFANLVRRFLEKHEGAMWVGLNAEPLDALARVLRSGGYTTDGPVDGIPVRSINGVSGLPPSAWRTLDVSGFPGNYLFFWHFTPGWDQLRTRVPEFEPTRVRSHRNTARRLRTSWLAVWSVDVTARAFERMGAKAGEVFSFPILRAKARRVAFPRGDALLLEPAALDSPVNVFLVSRGENLMGISIEVRDLSIARRVLERGLGRPLEPYRGIDGRSLLVPPEQGHGVYLEWVQPGD